MAQKREIEGTTIFDGGQAAKGYQLNKMCFSFNEPENRKAFVPTRPPIATNTS